MTGPLDDDVMEAIKAAGLYEPAEGHGPEDGTRAQRRAKAAEAMDAVWARERAEREADFAARVAARQEQDEGGAEASAIVDGMDL